MCVTSGTAASTQSFRVRSGTAASRNPIALLIPCHRVVGRDGALTGYAYGTNRKERLLQIEKSLIRVRSGTAASHP